MEGVSLDESLREGKDRPPDKDGLVVPHVNLPLGERERPQSSNTYTLEEVCIVCIYVFSYGAPYR